MDVSFATGLLPELSTRYDVEYVECEYSVYRLDIGQNHLRVTCLLEGSNVEI